MGAPPKADWREERRKRAWALKQQGWLQKDIAAALGVSAGAVSQWLTRAREAGSVEAPARRSPPGRTHHPLGRRVRLLFAALGGAHLGTAWADADLAGQADPRSPLGDQRQYLGWPAVPAGSGGCLRLGRGGGLPARAVAQDTWQAI